MSNDEPSPPSHITTLLSKVREARCSIISDAHGQKVRCRLLPFELVVEHSDSFVFRLRRECTAPFSFAGDGNRRQVFLAFGVPQLRSECTFRVYPCSGSQYILDDEFKFSSRGIEAATHHNEIS